MITPKGSVRGEASRGVDRCCSRFRSAPRSLQITRAAAQLWARLSARHALGGDGDGDGDGDDHRCRRLSRNRTGAAHAQSIRAIARAGRGQRPRGRALKSYGRAKPFGACEGKRGGQKVCRSTRGLCTSRDDQGQDTFR